MKKIQWSVFLLISLLVACGPSNEQENLLCKEWNYVEMVDPQLNSMMVKMTEQDKDEIKKLIGKSYLRFEKGGNFYLKHLSAEEQKGSYKLSSDAKNLVIELDNRADSFAIGKLSQSELIITKNSPQGEYKLVLRAK